jgi:hypothetical protein
MSPSLSLCDHKVKRSPSTATRQIVLDDCQGNRVGVVKERRERRGHHCEGSVPPEPWAATTFVDSNLDIVIGLLNS